MDTQSENEIKEEEALDIEMLNRELDWCMAQIFLDHNSAFLASIMSNHNFIWTTSIPTAQTNGLTLEWNPDWFLSLPRPTRCTVLKHELWHPARLHFLRRGDRDPLVWNWACDISINNFLKSEGSDFTGTSPWIKTDLGETTEEDIYDYLMSLRDNGLDDKSILDLIGGTGWDPEFDIETAGDMAEDLTEQDIRDQINNVITADQIAQQAGEGGLEGSGAVKKILNQWLQPVVPWEKELSSWMQELDSVSHSWRRPNRRHHHNGMYLPSQTTDEGKLNHLMYFLDVSGSISDADVIRFNSEVAFIKKQFNPKKLTLVQFDTKITDVLVIEENDAFDEVKVIGRGGTMWQPVKEYIEKEKPTAAIIFTDMYFGDSITELKEDVPVLWVISGTYDPEPTFGNKTFIPLGTKGNRTW